MLSHKSVILCVALFGILSQVGHAQIPTACTDRQSLENLVCCPDTVDGVCGVSNGRGVCADVNFERYNTTTTDVRVNWPHYYTRVCKCNGNFGGYDCSRCKYGYYGADCGTKAILPRKPVRDFTDEEWKDFISILRMAKTYPSDYQVVLEESQPGTADLVMSNVTLYDLMIWLHHYAAKDGSDPFSPDYLDYAHTGPAFFTWHRWFHVFFEYEIQEMLKSTGRVDYHRFRFPYWDWRGEIQRSYGLPSEELFSIHRLGETRNISNRPVVFGDLVGDGWDAICLSDFYVMCDPNSVFGPLQRCPFTSDPNLCHSSNPDWPTMQEVNKDWQTEEYATPPFNIFSGNSFRSGVDFYPVESIEICREDIYCFCLPGGVDCTDNSSTIFLKIGIHSKVHYLPGIGFGEPRIPTELQGAMFDFGGSPNDPVFILHHLMLDCLLQEWSKLHPNSGYPVHPEVRDGHRKDDYLRTFFPLITNEEVFANPEEFGYYCQLPNLGLTEPKAPSPLEATFSFTISGSSVEVCVETKEAVRVKLILRDVNNQRYVREIFGSSGCGTFTGLPTGQHRVRAISRERVPGAGGERLLSEFFYFTMN